MGLSLRGRILFLVAVASLACVFIASRQAFDAENLGSDRRVGNVHHHRASRRLLQDDDFVAEDSVAEDSVAEESVADDSVAEDSVAEDSLAEDSVAEDSVAEDSVAEESVGEDSVAEDSVAEDSAVADSAVEENAGQEDVDPRRLRAQRHESASEDDGSEVPTQGTSHFLHHQHADKPVEISPTLAKRYRLMQKQGPKEDAVVKPKLDPSLLPEETPEEAANDAVATQAGDQEFAAAGNTDETVITDQEDSGNAEEEPQSDGLSEDAEPSESVSTEGYAAALSEALEAAGNDLAEEEQGEEPASTVVADVIDESAFPVEDQGVEGESEAEQESNAAPVAGLVHTDAHDEDPEQSVMAFADSPSPADEVAHDDPADHIPEEEPEDEEASAAEVSDATPVASILHTEAVDEDPDQSVMAFADSAKHIEEGVRAAEVEHEAAVERAAMLLEMAEADEGGSEGGEGSRGADASNDGGANSEGNEDGNDGGSAGEEGLVVVGADRADSEVEASPSEDGGAPSEEVDGGDGSSTASKEDEAAEGGVEGALTSSEEVDESVMAFVDQSGGASEDDGSGLPHVTDDDAAIEAAIREGIPENVDESGQVLFRLPVTDNMLAAEGDMDVGKDDLVVVPSKDVLGGGEVVAGDELAAKEEEVAKEDQPPSEDEVASQEEQPLWEPHPWKHNRADLYDAVGDEGLTCDGVVRQNDDGSLQALIANPREQAHASNLAMLPSGDLALAFFSGVENHDGCGIAFAKLPSGSFQWSTPAIVSEWAGHSAQNPVLFFDQEASKLFLLHTTQNAEEGQGTSSVLLLVSADEGATWSDPAPLFTQHGAFIRNQMLLSKSNNDWLLPMYYTPSGMGGANIRDQFSAMKVYTQRPDALHGERHWEEFTMTLPGQYVVQPTVVRLRTNDDVLLAYYRDRKRKSIFMANSTDEGRTWSVAEPTPLPNNNKAIQACVLRNGNIVMAFGNNQGSNKWGPMALALSEDDGRTWPYVRDLEDVFDEGLEYSYPSVLETPNGDIHVSYTWSYQVKRVTIRYKVVSEDWIRLGTTIGYYQPATKPQPSLQAVEEDEPKPEESTSLLTGLAEELEAAVGVGHKDGEDDGVRSVGDGGPDEISDAEVALGQQEEESAIKVAYTTERDEPASEDVAGNEGGIEGLENVSM